MRKWLAILIALIALILAFLPKIASTSLGKPFFVKALEAKSHSKVTVASLHLSWFGPQKFQNLRWAHDSVTGTIEELQIHAPFWSFSGAFRLKNGSIRYKGGSVEQIKGQIEGNDFELSGITLQGHLSLKGTVYSKFHFHVQIDIKNFPLIVIDQRLDQILGPTLDLSGWISMDQPEGTIHLDASSANLKTSLRGSLTKEAIFLREPLIASIRLTPALSTLLLKDANPLFLTGIEAQNPVILRIEPEDFSFPIPYSLEKLEIGRATLDLGKVRCQNGKSLATIISLLKATRLSEVEQMNAWFTPVTFQIHRGILKAGRMDALLADSIHVCTWGRIHLIKDRMEMILGLPADTLQQAFGIKNLPETYIFKIEVRGSTKDPEIAKGAAAVKIAALIATGQSSLAELFTKQKEAPPAKRPFPWEQSK